MNYNYNKIKDMTVEQLLNSFIEFLNEKDNKMIVYKLINQTPIDYKHLYNLIPFLSEDDISFILKYDKDYSVEFLLSLANKADEDDLTRQAIYLLKRHNLKYITPLLDYIDDQQIIEEYKKSI